MRYYESSPFEGAVNWSMGEIKLFLDQMIAFEQSHEIKEYVKIFQEIWKRNMNLDKEEIQTYIVELKLNQKLENGPMAMFAIMNESSDRNDKLYDLIASEFNFAALIKWINLTHSTAEWSSATTVEILSEIARGIHWDFMENIWDNNIVSCYSKILAVTKKKQEEREKQSISFDDCETIQELLHNMRTYYSDSSISKKDILSKMKLLTLTGDYVLPMDWCVALYTTSYNEDFDEVITSLFNEQYGNMRKLPGISKILIDGSGSMFTGVHIQVGNHNHYISRMEIAAYFGYMMYLMSSNAEIFFAVSNGSRHINFKMEIDKNTTIGQFAKLAKNITRNKDVEKVITDIGDGIFTTHCLKNFVSMGHSETTVDTLFIFTDSGDCAPHMEFPNMPAVRTAKAMYNVNVAHDKNFAHIIRNEQWEGYINGYSNYLLEKIFWDKGISNPLFKAAEFTGESYRISF